MFFEELFEHLFGFLNLTQNSAFYQDFAKAKKFEN